MPNVGRVLGHRGERERIAERVRDLLGVPAPDGTGRHRFRWDPGRRGAAAVGVLLLTAIAVTVWWFSSGQPQSVPVAEPGLAATPLLSSSATSPSSAPSSAPTTAASSPSAIVVDVAGKVVHPGIYRLPADSRVYDALQAAGGARPGVDTVTINLAAPLQDGQQVVVGVSGAAPPPGALSATATGGATSAVNLNTATLDQLEALPGIGPVLGQKILEWRDEHGRFDTVDQLNDVSGIGEITFAELQPLVTV